MRRFAAFLMIVLLACLPMQEGMAKAKKKAAPETEDRKYAAIIVDASSGSVLLEKNADRMLHPASLTKVMTLLLLFEQLQNGTTRLDDKIAISAHAASQQPSKLGLSPGASIRVEDAILAVVTKSANDIAAAIAEHVGGSEERFAIRMTRRARDIGMSHTTYKNASGLHNPGQVSSARDQAILARYILTRYPHYYRYFGTKQFTYRGKTHNNHNRLMNSYPGMDGFKTGFINASGFNLIASAKKDGRRLIGVVFGGRSWKARNDRMAILLNEGFAKVSVAGGRPAPVQPDAEIVPVVKIAQAEKEDMPLPEQKPVSSAIVPSTAQKPPVLKQTDGRGNAVRTSPSSSLKMQQNTDGRLPPSSLTIPDDAQNLNAAVQRIEAAPAPLLQKKDYAALAPRQMPAAPPNTLQLPPSYFERTGTVPPSTYPSLAPSAAQTDPAFGAPSSGGTWSIQIGAYNSRGATDEALRLARGKLPAGLSHAQPIIVPLPASEGPLFRARLGNLSREQAAQACQYFRDCLPVAP